MKVGELKKKLETLDDDLEIFVAPMVEMSGIGENPKKMIVSPFEHFKIIAAVISGSVKNEGISSKRVLLGFDESKMHESEIDPDVIGDFIN